MYYVLQKPDVLAAEKGVIIAALGYLISPLDFIPDPIPVAGYTDDAAAIGIALLLAQMYINDEIKAQARGKIKDIFGVKALEKLDED